MLITTPDVLENSLRDIRKQKKLSQTQIANQVALWQATISTFERKQKEMMNGNKKKSPQGNAISPAFSLKPLVPARSLGSKHKSN